VRSHLLLGLLCACDGGHPSHPESKAPTPTEALERLLAGNRRFFSGLPKSRSGIVERRKELATEQRPFAVVVCCSDSRVGPEVVFDQGLGDIFVVRTAGEIVDDVGLGSIEYAVEHLGSPLVVVLGHERCGAVAAALKGGDLPGHIGALARAIAPAVAESKGASGDALDNAVRAQIRAVVRQLRSAAPIVAELVHAGKVLVVGARYDLDTGVAEVVER
jgi:carbonic anhydrase